MGNKVTSLAYKRKLARLRRFINAIYSSKESSFYKNIWGKLNLKDGEIDFYSLPKINANHIIKRKFDERLYFKNGLFVKIAYCNDYPFLIAKTKDSIGKENYGEIRCERPLIFFENPHESIEKGLWFYGKNIIPILAENNLDITIITAGLYKIDSILGDTESIKKLVSKAPRHFDCGKITNITIVDSKFDENFNASLKKDFRLSKINMVLSAPETGPLGLSCEKKLHKRIFHPTENTLIETDENGYLIATQIIMMPTPIIRYQTRIKINEEKLCSCGSELSFSILN